MLSQSNFSPFPGSEEVKSPKTNRLHPPNSINLIHPRFHQLSLPEDNFNFCNFPSKKLISQKFECLHISQMQVCPFSCEVQHQLPPWILNSCPLKTMIIIKFMMQDSNIKSTLEIDSIFQENTFSMKRTTVTNAPMVVVNFTPIQTAINLNPIDAPNQVMKSHPIFNDDGNYYTPTFMLHQDRIRVEKNLEVFKSLHETRIFEIAEEKQQIFVPRPSKNSSFCCVCKSYYEDYLTHVEDSNHISIMEKSKFCKDITQLCKKFSKPIRKVKTAKAKNPKKETAKRTALPTIRSKKQVEGLTQTSPTSERMQISI